jgi:oxygen-independent coproporphyrinogen-3 oxidase
VKGYVDDLVAETGQYADVLGRRETAVVYFGGGTANILRPAEMGRLMDGVRRHFAVADSAEITFEGYPRFFTPGQIRFLSGLGVNRISIGVQVMKPELLRFSGRAPADRQIRAAIELCRKLGVACSADLIVGWFQQTARDVIADIDTLHSWGVTGIVIHPIGIQGGSVFAREKEKLPSAGDSGRTFLLARERLLELGYRADSYTDYQRAELPPVKFLSLYRNVLSNDKIGLGYGAHSVLAGDLAKPGVTFVNVAGLEPYRERVLSGTGCAQACFRFAAEDLRLLYVLKGLEGEPYLEADRYAELFGSDLEADFSGEWDALRERGWLDWPEGKGPRLKGDAIFLMAHIQRMLSEPRNRQLRGVGLRQGRLAD